MSIAHTNDARVLTMLRKRDLTRYQIHERLADQAEGVTDSVVNKLLEALYERELIDRSGVLYGLSKRGTQALQALDAARPVNRVDDEDADLWRFARAAHAQRIAEDDHMRLMKRGRIRATSAADLRAPPPRAGSEQALAFPSRYGNTLRYRDGRVTDMAGNPL